MTPPLRVLLVDDHDIVRESLRWLLEDVATVEVVGEAAEVQSAVVLAGRLDPDIVLLDLSMPGGGGLAAIAGLQEAAPKCRVVVLTSFATGTEVAAALAAGAAGFLLKARTRQELVVALEGVGAGDLVLDPEARIALEALDSPS